MQSSDNPVYLQVRDQLWQWIESRGLDSSERLPAERELAEQFNTTRVTLRQSLAQLEAEGRVYRSNRRGWYITPERLRYDPSLDVGFNRYATEQGFIPRTEALDKCLDETPKWLAERVGLEVGAPIYKVFRRRYVNGRCILVERSFINPAHCPGFLQHDAEPSLWKLFREQFNLEVGRRDIEIYPQAIGREAEALGVNPGSAGLYLQRRSFDQHDRFLAFDQEYWLHDAIKLVVKV